MARTEEERAADAKRFQLMRKKRAETPKSVWKTAIELSATRPKDVIPSPPLGPSRVTSMIPVRNAASCVSHVTSILEMSVHTPGTSRWTAPGDGLTRAASHHAPVLAAKTRTRPPESLRSGSVDSNSSTLSKSSNTMSTGHRDIYELPEDVDEDTNEAISTGHRGAKASSDVMVHSEIKDVNMETAGPSFSSLPRKSQHTTRRKNKVKADGFTFRRVYSRGSAKSVPRRNEDSDNASEKRVVRSSKAPSEKTPRRLPLDELVMISENLDGPSLETTKGFDWELTEDPISQSEAGEPAQQRRSSKNANIRPRTKSKAQPKRFGIIDLRDFKFPRIHQVSRRTKRRRQSSCSDGFSKQEKISIKSIMGTKHSRRNRSTSSSLSASMNKLTIVPDREVGDSAVHKLQPLEECQEHDRCPQLSSQVASSGLDDEDVKNKSQALEGVVLVTERVSILPSTKEFTAQPESSTSTAIKVDTANNTGLNTPKVVGNRKRKADDIESENHEALYMCPDVAVCNIPYESDMSQNLSNIESRAKSKENRKRMQKMKIRQQLSMVSIRRMPTEDVSDADDATSTQENRDLEEPKTRRASEFSDDGGYFVQESDSKTDTSGGDTSSNDDRGDESSGEGESRCYGSERVSIHKAQKSGDLNPEIRWLLSPYQEHFQHRPKSPALDSQRLKLDSKERGRQIEHHSNLTKNELGGRKLLQSICQPSSKRSNGILRIEAAHQGQDEETGPDGSPNWKIRRPDQSDLAVEVDDLIIDSPEKYPQARTVWAMQQSLPSCRPSTSVRVRYSSSNSSVPEHLATGSMKKNHQSFRYHSLIRRKSNASIPETEFDDGSQHVEVPESQRSWIPESTSFEGGPPDLQQVLGHAKFDERKYTFTQSAHFLKLPYLMAGGMTMRDAFQYTSSLQELEEQCPQTSTQRSSPEKRSLPELARMASILPGTIPRYRKRRTVSLPLIPPFLPVV